MNRIIVRVISALLVLAMILSFALVARAEDGNSFNAGVTITETEDGNICVTISDDDQTNAILQEQVPTLTVDCPFDEAYVLYGGQEIRSNLVNGKISFEVAWGGEYRIISGQPEPVCVAVIGDTGYETLVAAQEAAEPGDVIKLVADTEIQELILKEEITLDLNGYKLTAQYVFAVTTSNIVDKSADNTGVLVVNPKRMMVNPDNASLPIWNGEGFIFTDILYFTDQNTTNEKGQRVYKFIPLFETIAHQYLAQGTDSSLVKVAIRMTWDLDTGSAYQDFIYNDKTVKTVIDSFTNGWYTKAFYATIVNSELESLDIQVVLKSDTGVELVCKKN